MPTKHLHRFILAVAVLDILMFIAVFTYTGIPEDAFGLCALVWLTLTIIGYVYLSKRAPQFSKAVYFVGMLCIYGVLALGILLGDAWTNRANQPLVSALTPLLEADIPEEEHEIRLHGKALVWDCGANKLSRAHRLLPYAMRTFYPKDNITVFLVMTPRPVAVGSYSISHQNAYRQGVEVLVVLWPEKRVLGRHVVLSADPPSQRVVVDKPEYARLDEPIAKWIMSLPKAGVSGSP